MQRAFDEYNARNRAMDSAFFGHLGTFLVGVGNGATGFLVSDLDEALVPGSTSTIPHDGFFWTGVGIGAVASLAVGMGDVRVGPLVVRILSEKAAAAEAKAVAKAEAKSIKPKITFGHGERHLEVGGADPRALEKMISTDIQANLKGGPVGGYWGRVTLRGVTYQYRVYVLDDGTINVGTYYIPKPGKSIP